MPPAFVDLTGGEPVDLDLVPDQPELEIVSISDDSEDEDDRMLRQGAQHAFAPLPGFDERQQLSNDLLQPLEFNPLNEEDHGRLRAFYIHVSGVEVGVVLDREWAAPAILVMVRLLRRKSFRRPCDVI